MLENYIKAESAYLKAIELGADDPEILINLARVQLRLEKNADAAASFQQAMTMRPEIVKKYRTLAITLGSTY